MFAKLAPFIIQCGFNFGDVRRANSVSLCLEIILLRGYIMRKMRLEEIPSLMENEVQCIRLFSNKLKSKLKLRKIILFGSKSRGDFTEESDVDLLILVEEYKNWKTRRLVSDEKFDAVMEVDAYLSTVVENYKNWEEESDEVWLPLKDVIEEEGIEIEI